MSAKPDSADLNRAVVLYVRHGTAAWPQRDGAAVVREFGAERAGALLPRVASLLDEIGRIDLDWRAHTLASATQCARAELQRRHPELDDAALGALAWKFSYDWK